MTDLTEVEKHLTKAKLGLLLKPETTFISSIACQLGYKFDSNSSLANTNGKYITLNPEQFCELSLEHQIFVLAHETLHVAFTHMTRLGNKDHKLFNMACDYVINDILKNQNFSVLDDTLYDPRFHGLAAEQVYEILVEENKDNPDFEPDIEYVEEDAIKELESDIMDKIIYANVAAANKGQSDTIPSALREMLEIYNKPLIRWQTILKRFMEEVDKQDYSWSKPNRRVQHLGMYLPSLHSNTGLNKITFAIDTSGSIELDTFNQFISEIQNLFKSLKPKIIDLMQFDHELKYHKEIKSIEELKKIKFVGHGGTLPAVAIEAFKKTNSKALVIITDGEFDITLANPKRPVIWVVFNNPKFKAPYGKTIHFEI